MLSSVWPLSCNLSDKVEPTRDQCPHRNSLQGPRDTQASPPRQGNSTREGTHKDKTKQNNKKTCRQERQNHSPHSHIRHPPHSLTNSQHSNTSIYHIHQPCSPHLHITFTHQTHHTYTSVTPQSQHSHTSIYHIHQPCSPHLHITHQTHHTYTSVTPQSQHSHTSIYHIHQPCSLHIHITFTHQTHHTYTSHSHTTPTHQSHHSHKLTTFTH